MSHLKRLTIKNSWPLPRKGTKYLTCPHPGKDSKFAIPLCIVLRDLLKVASTRKEAKELLKAHEVYVDGKIAKELKFPISIFDTIGLPKIDKFYKTFLDERGKITFEEIKQKDAEKKICKIIGKKTLRRGAIQFNCSDGRNFISKEKIAVNDCIEFNLKENKIEKIMPIKNGLAALITGGAHIGETGKIAEIAGEKIKIKTNTGTFEIQPKNVYLI